MNQFLQYTPISITVFLIISITLVRKRSEIKQWWETMCEEAECTSKTGILFQALNEEERCILFEHTRSKNVRVLEKSSSEALAAIACDLGDYVDPHARLVSVERALAKRAAQQPQESVEAIS